MNNERINICIPCYNSEKYIEKLFKMIQNQTYDLLDVIFLNDGSTDKTKELIEENIAKNENKNIVFHLFNQENKGLSNARNNLISYSKNKYIIFVDHDDELYNDSFETLYNEISSGDYDIVCGKTKIKLNSLFSIANLYQIRWKRKMSNRHYVKSNLCLPWGLIFKKEIFNNYKFLENYDYEDIGLLSYIYLKTKKFKFIKKYVYIYYRHDNSLSSFKKINKWKSVDLYFQTKHLFNFFKKDGWIDSQEYIRPINGVLFQIFIPCILLSKHYSKNKKINSIVNCSFIKLLDDYNKKIKFSKTFSKSIAFFYIILNLKKSKRIIKNNKPFLKFNFNKINNLNENVKNTIIELDEFSIENIQKYSDNSNLFTLKMDHLKNIKKEYLNNYEFGLKINKKNDYLNIGSHLDRLYYIDLTSYQNDIIEIINLINSYSYRIMFILNDNDYLNLKEKISNKWLIIIKEKER